MAQPLADLVSRTAGADVREPIATRLRRGRRDDLDSLRVPQGSRQWSDAAVDLGARAMQPYLGVDGEGEVDRRGTLGQLMHVAFRREDEDLLGVKVELQELEEFVG